MSSTAVNLLPVSMTPVANNGNNIRQLTPESEFEEKMYLYVNSTTQRCKNILKIFRLKIFFICRRCQRHLWCTLSCEIANISLAGEGVWGSHFKRGDRHCGSLGIYVLCPLISVSVASSKVPNVLPIKSKAASQRMWLAGEICGWIYAENKQ